LALRVGEATQEGLVETRPILDAQDEAAFAAAQLDLCAAGGQLYACDAARDYLRDYPAGHHREEVERAVREGLPRIEALRQRQEDELAARIAERVENARLHQERERSLREARRELRRRQRVERVERAQCFAICRLDCGGIEGCEDQCFEDVCF
jgi:hypothetical protein